MQLLLEKIAKNHDFGDFWWFSCSWHDVTYDVTVASYKVCLYFFWYLWTREGHSYPLVPHTWYFVIRFPRSWGGGIPPAVRWVQKSPALLGLNMLRCRLIMWRSSGYIMVMHFTFYNSQGVQEINLVWHQGIIALYIYKLVNCSLNGNNVAHGICFKKYVALYPCL